MPRRKLRDTAHEREVLSSKVNPTGAGEDAPVRDVLSPEFAHKSDSEALDTVLALQQIIRGQSSLLANIDKFGEELIHLRERMNKYDKAAEAWKKDQQGFLERSRRKSHIQSQSSYEYSKSNSFYSGRYSHY
ncbi:MAG: hypothetical protein DDT31_01041 [Syntrophomonadaceae bacterium]|nr:hypothetical protein [Bacillota bacterium]